MDDEIYLDLEFEYLLSYLFGKSNHHATVGYINCKDWSKNIYKIIDAIEKGILQNIVFTDNYQKNELINICSETKVKINSSKQINNVNQDVIIGMTKLIFNLIGQMPDNWDRKVVNHPNHRKLNKHRTIHFSQNNRQKANLIMSLAKLPGYNNGLPTLEELNQKFYIELANDELKFVTWFKHNFPENYIKMFLA